MKKHLQILIFTVALGVIFGSATASFGQIKVGGYKSVAVTDAMAVAAAEFAVKTQSEKEEVIMSVESLKKAERQVVQGSNYKLCIEVYYPSDEDETDGVLQFVQAVVYQNLKGQFSLSKWEEADCAPEE